MAAGMALALGCEAASIRCHPQNRYPSTDSGKNVWEYFIHGLIDALSTQRTRARSRRLASGRPAVECMRTGRVRPQSHRSELAQINAGPQ